MKNHSPFLVRLRESEAFAILTVCVATFTDEFLYGVVVPVMPVAIVNRAGVPAEDAQKWISILLASYGLAVVIGSPIIGYLVDTYKAHRWGFIFGIFTSAFSTLLFMISKSLWALIVARIFQGLSAALVSIVGLAFLTDVVDESRISQAMGYFNLAMTSGILLGPVLGGFVFTNLGFNATFALPIFFLAIDIPLRLLVIVPKDKVSVGISSSITQIKVDTSDNSNTSCGTEPKNRTSSSGALTERTPLLLPSAEPKESHPEMKPMAYYLITSPRVLTAVITMFAASSMFTAFESTLPLFVMRKFVWTATSAGLLFLCLTIPGCFGMFIGNLIDYWGTRLPAFLALVLMGPPLIFLRLVEFNDIFSKAILISSLTIIGFCFQFIQLTAMTNILQATSHIEKMHSATGASGKGQSWALCIIAVAGAQSFGPTLSIICRDWPTLTLVLGIISMCLAVPALLFTGGNLLAIKKKMTSEGDC